MTGSMSTGGTPGRTLSSAVYGRLKGAFRLVVKSVGGLESAANFTRVNAASLGNYQNINAEQFAPADVLADLETEGGLPEVTRVLADLSGYLIIPKPPAAGSPTAGPVWSRGLGAMAKECGDAIARVGEALADDGAITAQESLKLKLRAEIGEAMVSLAALDQALKNLEGESE